MSDDHLFIVVEGVGPADFPENEASSTKQDEAVALANDIHDLIREGTARRISRASFRWSIPTPTSRCRRPSSDRAVRRQFL
ncbi:MULTISPECIES: hypothetical protein [unclassified Haloarcula]|uniref:hypothetical protein n=1 Tax=unclassified Haloarcula TaxID=2624677 RepID=UPI001E381C02|nr:MULTISPECIES: hypothetical protein [unclassified Haloarcula]